MTVPRRLRTAFIAAATTAVVLGCSTPAAQPEPAPPADPPAVEHPEPPPDTAEDPAPQPEETFVAELTMVPRPAEMDRDDEVGAAAAAEYFLFAYTYAYGTGDVDPLQALAGPECGFCASVISAVGEHHSGDGYLRAGDPVIHSVHSAVAEQEETDYLVWLGARLPEMRSYDAEHTVVQIHPASDIDAGFALGHRQGDWVVLGATFEAGSS